MKLGYISWVQRNALPSGTIIYIKDYKIIISCSKSNIEKDLQSKWFRFSEMDIRWLTPTFLSITHTHEHTEREKHTKKWKRKKKNHYEIHRKKYFKWFSKIHNFYLFKLCHTFNKALRSVSGPLPKRVSYTWKNVSS